MDDSLISGSKRHAYLRDKNNRCVKAPEVLLKALYENRMEILSGNEGNPVFVLRSRESALSVAFSKRARNGLRVTFCAIITHRYLLSS